MEAFVIGDKSIVLGFKLVGIRGIPVSNKSEALDALREAVNMKDVKIILITEILSSQIHDEIDAIRSRISAPVITEVPGRFEVTGKLPSTQKLMEKVLRIRV